MFWNFTSTPCHNCGEPVWAPLSHEPVVAECQNCGELTHLPPASPRLFARRRRLIFGLIGGVLAALLAVGTAIGWMVWAQFAAGWRQARLLALHDRAERAYQAGRHAEALESLTELVREDVLSDYEVEHLAECQRAVGDPEAARATFERLASSGAPPFSTRANLRLARDLLDDLGKSPPPDERAARGQLAAAEAHLTRVVHDDPAILEARQLMLAILLPHGRLRDAIPHLKALSDSSPNDRLSLAAAYEQTGDASSGRREAQSVLQYALTMTSEKPAPEHRMLASRAAEFLGDYALAEDLLRGGQRTTGCDAPPWTGALAELYWLWAVSAAQHRPGAPPNAEPPVGESVADVERLEQSLRIDPGSARTYLRLKQIGQRSDAAGEAARTVLEKELARGDQPVLVHCLLAELASESKRPAEAVLHWRAALGLAPQLAVAMNNLASELTWCDPPDLVGALRWVDRAIELEPGMPAYHETRGQIFARQGRHEEALAELTGALEALPDNARLHATLAELYRAKGLDLPARTHAAIAARLAGPEPLPAVLPQ